MKYAELAKKSLEELMQPVLDAMTPERCSVLSGPAHPSSRLAGLAPEQRLAGLAPEQRLAGLAPEQRLAGLTPEQIERALAARPRAAGKHAKRRPR